MPLTLTFDQLSEFFAFAEAVAERVDTIPTLSIIIQNQENIMQELDDLKAQVASSIAGEESARVLLDGLVAKLDVAIAALPDPTALTDLSASLKTSADALAASVVADARP